MKTLRQSAQQSARRLALIAALGIAPVACIQPPTESASVSDLRPGISFNTATAGDAVVFVDGQRVGVVSDFLSGHGVLRVVAGTHQVQVVRGDATLLDERIYLGDGVNRTFRVE